VLAQSPLFCEIITPLVWTAW